MEEETIYSLNASDIQTVAKDVLDRELSEKELSHIKELVPKERQRNNFPFCHSVGNRSGGRFLHM